MILKYPVLIVMKDKWFFFAHKSNIFAMIDANVLPQTSASKW